MRMTKKKVSIQGIEGCFHQVAARQFFGKTTEVVCCSTFKEVIQNATSSKQAAPGIMAIENSIAGSILPNYRLLLKSPVNIVGEVYLHIKQHLLVNSGVQLQDIREVHSHYMALQQCDEFLDRHNWKLVETEDTALGAKQIHQHKNKHAAAIAGNLAAEIYGLEILVPNIHTIKNNYTRFLVIQHADAEYNREGVNKASVNFVAGNQVGSLAKLLTVISDEGINLSKLQSMPIPGSNFSYSFHADMEFSELVQFERLIKKMKDKTENLVVLGIYKNGKIN